MLYKCLSAVRSPLAPGPAKAKINYRHLTEINSRYLRTLANHGPSFNGNLFVLEELTRTRSY